MSSGSLTPANPSISFSNAFQSATSFKIPSWVSLYPNSSSTKSRETKNGFVENVHLVSLSKQFKLQEAAEFMGFMNSGGISINIYTYKCLFDACGTKRSLSYGKFFHEEMKKSLKNPPMFLDNHILSMYCDCGSFVDARGLFDKMSERSTDVWNTIISAYARDRNFFQAFTLISEMQFDGFDPNALIYSNLIRELFAPFYLILGKQIHSQVIRHGLNSDIIVSNALCNMYAKCQCLEDSERIFHNMMVKNVFSWMGMMVNYSDSGKNEETLDLFIKMIKENVQIDQFLFSIALKASSSIRNIDIGKQIHGHIVKLGMDADVSVGTPLVDFYVKCQILEEAVRAFNRISNPNAVSWSALIAGYSQFGRFEETLQIFKYLKRKNISMNSFIYTNVFQACSALADINSGCQVHCDSIKRGLISELYGESALITMYSRAGNLDYALLVFGSIIEHDHISFSAMISGLACHGHASEAFKLFDQMKSLGLKPNHITFMGILTACSHAGLVLEAEQFFDSMRDYSVEPTSDHYNCMVDVYCRAGRLNEAYRLIQTKPCIPDQMTWKILLGGCRTSGNLELGKIAGQKLIEMNPEDESAYVLLFNLFTSASKWIDAANIRKLMRERGIKKEVSCSWMVMKDRIHRFIVGDKHHPLTDQIYLKLSQLNCAVSEIGYPISQDKLSSALSEERKEQLLDHSEKLAIAFGLLSTASSLPILIFKNLRICRDCHFFTKMVSRITGREIRIRDSTRFHHFKNGECSCNDYW